MQVFFDAFGTVLAFFYDLVPNYAFAIVMLTLAVMVVVTPLTLKGTRSMMMMQQLQPEMKKIQTRYKDDRQKLNEELLKFYKENSINPLGGCLPLLVQMPVFLVLYQVLRGLTQRVSGLGYDIGWATNQVANGLSVTKAPDIVRVFDPQYLDTSSSLYTSLSGQTQMRAFGLDLSESASKSLQQGILHALPFLILIVLVGVTGFIQQRQIQGRNPNASINPQQQMIMKIMPIFLPVISFGLPAGLVLYFAVSNLYRIGQQAFISRSIYGMKRGKLPADSPLANQEPQPQPSFREMFGLAKRNAADTAAAKTKAKSTSKATTGATTKGGAARSKAIAATSSPASPGGKGGSSASKATTKPAKPTAAKPAAKKAPAPRGRTTRAKPAGTPASTGGKDAGATGPVLQPRARKNPKKG